jgi:hypothetical protein
LIERYYSYDCKIRPSVDEILVILKQKQFHFLQSWEERQAAFMEGINAKGMGSSA